jgi:arsenate reductase (glutaredoxin)
MAVIVYGIKNCSTVKKARDWLAQHQIAYQFHDYKTDGISLALVNSFLNNVSYEELLNKRGTTWRNLSETEKTDLTAEKAVQLFISYPSLIKRPIILSSETFIIGFNADEYQAKL